MYIHTQWARDGNISTFSNFFPFMFSFISYLLSYPQYLSIMRKKGWPILPRDTVNSCINDNGL